MSLVEFLKENLWFYPLFAYGVMLCRGILLTAGVYFLLWELFSNQLNRREIQNKKLYPGQIKKEIKNTLISYLAMSLGMWPLFLLYAFGKTAIYHDWNDYPLYFIPISLFIFMAFHDIYFALTHKWLHKPWAYKHIHYIHHESHVPTPFASHSFHWFEGLIQVGFIYPLVIFMPMHLYTFLAFMTITHFFALWGHFNYELMPFSTWNSWWGKWVTTSTHHNIHHQYNKGNFGLYWRGWDKIWGTLHPKTKERFDKFLNS